MDVGNLIDPRGVTGGNPAGSDGVQGSRQGGSVVDPGVRKYPGWTDHLPGDLKRVDVLDKLASYERLGDMVKAYFDLEGRLQKALVVPEEGSSPEVVNEFRKKLGIPASASDYKLSKEQNDVAEEGLDDWFKGQAHRLNMTQRQTEMLYRAFVNRANDQIGKMREAQKQKATDAARQLQAELKDKFDATLATARKTVEKYGGKEFAGFLKESGMDNDARMVRFVANLGLEMADDQLPVGGMSGDKQKSSDPFDPRNWQLKF